MATLNHLVSLQRRGTGEDALGQRTDAWATYATPWASIRYVSGTEAIRAGADRATLRCSLMIYARTDVLHGDRVLDALGTVYDIEAILPDLERRVHMFLVCKVMQ